MPPKRRPPRRQPLSYFDAQDRMLKLSNIYRTDLYGSNRTAAARDTHADLDNVATPEPDVDLEDAELTDSERMNAIARERQRRDGIV